MRHNQLRVSTTGSGLAWSQHNELRFRGLNCTTGSAFGTTSSGLGCFLACYSTTCGSVKTCSCFLKHCLPADSPCAAVRFTAPTTSHSVVLLFHRTPARNARWLLPHQENPEQSTTRWVSAYQQGYPQKLWITHSQGHGGVSQAQGKTSPSGSRYGTMHPLPPATRGSPRTCELRRSGTLSPTLAGHQERGGATICWQEGPPRACWVVIRASDRTAGNDLAAELAYFAPALTACIAVRQSPQGSGLLGGRRVWHTPTIWAGTNGSAAVCEKPTT